MQANTNVLVYRHCKLVRQKCYMKGINKTVKTNFIQLIFIYTNSLII